MAAKYQQAIALHRQGNIDAAAGLYDEILKTDPAHFGALHLLGVTRLQGGNAEDAAVLLAKAVQLDKKQSAAHNNLGSALRALKRHDEALASYNRAIALQVDNAEAHHNRALVLLDLLRLDQALAGFRKAVALRPDYADAHTNLGVTLQAMDRGAEALEAFDRALALQPGAADVHHNRGHALQGLRRYAEARQAFERAISLNPQHAEAHVALSECMLQAGETAGGWREYEWRWSVTVLAPLKRHFQQPVWLSGQDIAGKTLLIHAEQGLGDTLQFCRYVKLAAERGAEISFEVQPQLRRLMESLAGPRQVISRGDPLPDFDLHCPLLSLPLALGGDPGTAADAYLNAVPGEAEGWQAKLGTSPRPRCGLVWSGAASYRGSARHRSIPLAELQPLAACGADLIGLQVDVREGDRPSLETFHGLKNFGPELRDFADTAALIAALDLVITVDTSVAHLAGAMGKPVWILLAYAPDWRWELGGGEQSPWYPTARLFRQPKPHDWASVVNAVAGELRALSSR